MHGALTLYVCEVKDSPLKARARASIVQARKWNTKGPGGSLPHLKAQGTTNFLASVLGKVVGYAMTQATIYHQLQSFCNTKKDPARN